MLSFKIKLFGETDTAQITPLTLIVLLAITLRVPTLFEPYWYGDEAIYLAVGEGMRQGLVLYKDIFDHKPPAIYLLATLAGSLFWFKFMLLVWHTATVILFWKLAHTLLKQPTVPSSRQSQAVVAATLVFTLLTTLPLLEGNLVNAELLMTGPVIAAFLIIFRSSVLSILRLTASGTFLSLAVLFKIPAGFEILALPTFWFISSLWKPKEIGLTIIRSLALALVIIIPFTVFALYFWSKNALGEYLAAGILINFGYISSWSTSTNVGFNTGLIFRVEVLGAILLLITLAKKIIDRTTLFVCLWFTFAIFAMLLSGRPYPHYLIQAVAPGSLLVAILVSGAQRYRFLPIPLLLISLASIVFYQFYSYPTFPYYKNFLSFVAKAKTQEDYFTYFDKKTIKTYKLASFLKTRTQENEKVFIWGIEPEVYALAHRVPPTRFVTSFHIIDFSAKDEVLSALVKNPPQYIIRITTETRQFPEFEIWLRKNYLHTEIIDTAEIWKLKKPEFKSLTN